MKAWEQFLNKLAGDIGEKTVERWLRNLKVVRFDARNLYLEAKDAFQLLWFEEHIRKLAEKSFVNNNNHKIKIHITTSSFFKCREGYRRTRNYGRKKDPEQKFTLDFESPDSNLVIERFVHAKNNLLAHKLICKIIHFDPISNKFIPGDLELASFNPIYLHGPSGTGKTHLLHAIYHALKSRNLRIIYVTAEKFTEHVVSAIRSGEMNLFRNTYRNTDIFLIDDIHFLGKKGATQEEFFHTFNALHLAGKQIIVASNCAPQELRNIEPRLVSRFEWGIVLSIDPLSDEDLPKVLEEKLKAMRVSLSQKIIQFLLDSFSSSPKALLGALETLIYRYSLKEEPKGLSRPETLSLAYAKKQLRDLIEEEHKLALTPQKIVNRVAAHFNLATEDIYKKSRKRKMVVPRHLAIYFCRTKLGIPYKTIGEIFAKDHSTVMSSVKIVKKGLENNEREIVTPYFAIERQLHP